MFNEKKAEMDPNKPPFLPGRPGVPGVPGVPVARGRGLFADEHLSGRARGLGLMAGDGSFGRARSLATASEEHSVGRAHGLAQIVAEPSIGRARGLSVQTDEPSVGRARGVSAVAPAGRGRGLISAAFGAPLFPHGSGSPGLGRDEHVGVTPGTQQQGSEGPGRARGLLHTPQEPVVGKGRSMTLSVKKSELPGESKHLDTSGVIPSLQKEEPPKSQVNLKKNGRLMFCC